MQLPGLRARLNDGDFRVRVRKRDVNEDSLQTVFNEPMSHDVIHIVPVVAGSKNSGLISVIAGVAMVAAAFLTGGASLAAWGALSVGLAAAGTGMLIAGTAMMLAPTPDAGKPKVAQNGDSNSYFNSLDNSIAQGSCVPLIYGKIMVGSKVLSQGLNTYDEIRQADKDDG